MVCVWTYFEGLGGDDYRIISYAHVSYVQDSFKIHLLLHCLLFSVKVSCLFIRLYSVSRGQRMDILSDQIPKKWLYELLSIPLMYIIAPFHA